MSAFLSLRRRAISGLRFSIPLNDITDESDATALIQQAWTGVSNVLVCGDGDLSYSAWLSEQLAEADVALTATVLESEEVHNSGAL